MNLLVSLLLSWILVSTAWASDLGNRIAGEPFCDPTQSVAKPPEWIARPIVHDSWGRDADLAVTLDQHLYPALLPLTEAFAKERGVRIAVKEGTCGFSEGMLNNKMVEITGLCCPPGQSDRLPTLRFHTFGIAALAILVPEENPIDNASRDEVRQLFMGKYRSWAELPSAAAIGFQVPVQPVTRLHCPTKPGHWRTLLDNESQFAARKIEIKEISDYIAKVAHYKGNIGYEVLWNRDRYQGKLPLKALRVDGYAPDDSQAVIARKYPFYAAYTMTTWERSDGANALARELIQYYRQHFDAIADTYHIIPSGRLQAAGWKFQEEELIGEP